MLEALCSRRDYDSLDFGVGPSLFFLTIFFAAPEMITLCGCPEKKFQKKSSRLRENGLTPEIAVFLQDEDGIEVFPQFFSLFGRIRECA